MTDTELISTEKTSGGDDRGGRSGSSQGGADLSSMRLPELKALAVQLGIKGTSGMRKGQLLDVVQQHQSGARTASAPDRGKGKGDSEGRTDGESVASNQPPAVSPTGSASGQTGEAADAGSGAREGGSADSDGRDEDGQSSHGGRDRTGRNAPPHERRRSQSNDSSGDDTNAGATNAGGTNAGDRNAGDRNAGNKNAGDRNAGNKNAGGKNAGNKNAGGKNAGNKNAGDRNAGNKNADDKNGGNKSGSDNQPGNHGGSGGQGDGDGRRGRRFRERRRGGRDRGDRNEPMVQEDDVLQPVAGIIDVLDNYAFVRTTGYLSGPEDVYVSMNMVRKNGLRRGDAITGAVRLPREGDRPNQRQKFNPLVRLDNINGVDVETAKKRPDFAKLTPLYPNQRLRLETDSNQLTTRLIDLIMPIGKGQRALVVSPPKAGKTTILQGIANAVATNNPECYLMVVLVDERPEEVTDMQRSVQGEVIASTFDRPPSDHTSVAELAIERAKRLVESGKDVVVLLDSITRLGRAYNNSSPASGRILSGGVDSTALFPPKRFLGAARNIENGGSLTIIATAMVETGSQGDTVIFEEFKGTGNAELKLDRKIAERRVFPAVDINPSATRRDDLLLAPEEAAIVHRLRRVMSGLDSHQAIDMLIEQLKKTKNNYEFLMGVSKSALGAAPE